MLFLRLKKINQKCNIGAVYSYCKVNFIQALLEAALTVFLLESLLIYSEYFSDTINLEMHGGIFLLPITLAAIIWLGFILRITWIILEKFASDSRCNQSYEIIQSDFKSLFKNVHIAGFLCYTLTSLLTLILIYCAIKPNEFHKLVLLQLSSMMFGALWNIRGYWGDQRLDWEKLFKSETIVDSIDENIRAMKFKYTIKHIFLNCFSVVIALSVFIYIAIAPRTGELMQATVGDSTLSSHGFFLFSFFVVLAFYIKTLFPLFYGNGKGGGNSDGIYCHFNEMLKEDGK